MPGRAMDLRGREFLGFGETLVRRVEPSAKQRRGRVEKRKVGEQAIMRNGQKRMRGRHNNGGQRKSQNPLTRVYESNGPDVKIRGTASHIAEKYIQLARDAQSSGDPVAAENYYQHAEHYFRLIAAAQEQFRQQNPYYNPQQQNQQGQARRPARRGRQRFRRRRGRRPAVCQRAELRAAAAAGPAAALSAARCAALPAARSAAAQPSATAARQSAARSAERQ